MSSAQSGCRLALRAVGLACPPGGSAHRLLMDGVKVKFTNTDGEKETDHAQLIDFQNPANNDFLVVNQWTPSLPLCRADAQHFVLSVSRLPAARLTVTGTKKPRRPDLVAFVNGLPLGIIELKNPADTNVDVWKAYQQPEMNNPTLVVVTDRNDLDGQLYQQFCAAKDLLKQTPEQTEIRLDPLCEAAFKAGRAFLEYRRQGGSRRAPLPDFFIGAHAEVGGMTLLTRDAARYRTYFPKVKLIAPE